MTLANLLIESMYIWQSQAVTARVIARENACTATGTRTQSKATHQQSGLLPVPGNSTLQATMQVDAARRASTQLRSGMPAASAQATSSDDCSAVNLAASAVAQDRTASAPSHTAVGPHSTAQLAMHTLSCDSSQERIAHASATTSNRRSKKRKQPSQDQKHAAPSTSISADAAALWDSKADVEQAASTPRLSWHEVTRKAFKARRGHTEARMAQATSKPGTDISMPVAL